jgi:general secretion pathway protein I
MIPGRPPYPLWHATRYDFPRKRASSCQVLATPPCHASAARRPAVAAAQRGFTLLEMLAALVVLAVCCTVLLTAFGQSARALQQVQRSDRLSLAAQSLLDELGSGPLHPGRSSGTWDGVQWQLEIRPQSAAVARVAVYRLDLTVTESRRQATYSTLQVRSAGSGAQP